MKTSECLKNDDFSITQILREINFGDSSRSAESAILTQLEALNSDSYEF